MTKYLKTTDPFGTGSDNYFPDVPDDDYDPVDPDDELLDETPADVIAMIGFDPRELENDEGEAVTMGGARSPEGGVNIGGDFFPGGQWIPEQSLDKATDEEKQTIAEGGNTKKPDDPVDRAKDLKDKMRVARGKQTQQLLDEIREKGTGWADENVDYADIVTGVRFTLDDMDDDALYDEKLKAMREFVLEQAGVLDQSDDDDAADLDQAFEDDAKPERAVLAKAKKLAVLVLKASNAAPVFAAEVAKEAGASPAVARTALIAATIGDFSIPGVPVGSAVVLALASVKSPGASYRVARNAIQSLMKRGDKTGATAMALSDKDKRKLAVDIAKSAEESGDPDNWFVGYMAALDLGASHEAAMRLADEYLQQESE